MILGILGLLGFAAIVIAGAAGAFKTNSKTLDEVTIGNCYQLPAPGTKVTHITEISCDKPHDGEAFFQGKLNPDGKTTFPGEQQAVQQAGEQCVASPFKNYVGAAYPTHGLDVFSIVVTADAWKAEHGRFSCFVVNADSSELTGSVKGIAG